MTSVLNHLLDRMEINNLITFYMLLISDWTQQRKMGTYANTLLPCCMESHLSGLLTCWTRYACVAVLHVVAYLEVSLGSVQRSLASHSYAVPNKHIFRYCHSSLEAKFPPGNYSIGHNINSEVTNYGCWLKQ